MSKETARERLRAKGLRATQPRLAVLQALAGAERPVSHSEMLARLGETDWDPATVYRNLVKLTEAGLTEVVSRAGGIDRYALADDHEAHHHHPHFVCDDCGRVACLPHTTALISTPDDAWAASVRAATVQLRGACPECREA